VGRFVLTGAGRNLPQLVLEPLLILFTLKLAGGNVYAISENNTPREQMFSALAPTTDIAQ